MTIASNAARMAAITALAGGVAGCHDPYRAAPSGRVPTPTFTAVGDADAPGPPAPATPASRPASPHSARAAAVAFARAWANWDWRTAAAQQRTLARLAGPRLAAELEANARAAAADASLARDRPGSRGSVIAIDLHTRGGQASAVLVTVEHSYTAGRADLGGQHHRVYRAGLSRSATGGWEVSQWTPLP